jgi:hypothetical protein
MSLGTPSLKCETVLDSRVNIDSIRRYNIFKGGKNVSWKPIISTSFSPSSWQFTAPPPNPAVIVDREIYVLVSARLAIKGVKITGTDNKLLNIGVSDALRAYPISNALINTLQLTINNTAVSINMSDVIEPLLRYNVPEIKRGKIFSMSPSMQDQFQEYADWSSANTTLGLRYASTPLLGVNNILNGGARNPLSGYGVGAGDEMTRGGFQSINIVSDKSGNDTVGDAIVDVLLCEPIFLSPLLFGGEGPGFIGVQTMDFNFTLNGSLGRIWSRADYYPANTVNTNVVATNYITSIDVTFSNQTGEGGNTFGVPPTLLFNYITPGELMPIHREYVYPYFNIDRYPSPSQDLAGLNLSTPTTLNASLKVSTKISSNNIQLQSIPRRIYLFGRESNDARSKINANSRYPDILGISNSKDYYSGSWNHSDSYAVIKNISVNYNNNAGLLSSASQQDLYRIAVNNGCQQSWNQWSNTNGSVLALDFGKDIQLGDLEAPGKLMTSQLQIDVSFTNTSLFARTITLYIVVVSEGTFTIVDNRCITQIGVVSENDIFEASKNLEKQPYTHVQNIYGGDFFSGLKQLIKEAAHKAVDEGVELGEKAIMGKGVSGGELSGAGVSGGKIMSRATLKKRLTKKI